MRKSTEKWVKGMASKIGQIELLVVKYGTKTGLKMSKTLLNYKNWSKMDQKLIRNGHFVLQKEPKQS